MTSNYRSVRWSKVAIATLGSAGAVLMSSGAILVALQFQSQRFQNVSPWHMLVFLARITTGLQVVQFVSWAAITGFLIALGVNAASVSRVRAAAVLAAGALVPIGLALFAHQLNRIWPDTTGPTQVPALGGLLALYSLAIPWALGRLIRRWVPTHHATQQPMTSSP
jgi:hypothetical protein